MPTAGTEGGDASCFHFWSEDFRSISKNPHPHATVFWAHGSPVGTDNRPALHPVEELT